MRHVRTSELLAAQAGIGLTHPQQEHLATCDACADWAKWLDRLRDSSATLPPMQSHAPVPSIGRARTAGRDRPRFVPRAAAAAVVFAATALAIRGTRVDGLLSELRFPGNHVTAGADVPVEYTPAPWLSSEDSLVVRARFRVSDDMRYDPTLPAVAAGVLRRDGSGPYRGELHIPDDAVFGVFAVESADGSTVDANQRRLWDVRIEGPGGPRAAMQQHVNDLLSRNWESAARLQREWAEAHPDDALAWKDVFFLDQEVVPHTSTDSLLAWHSRRFAALDSLHDGDTDPGGDNAAALMWYAIGLGDTASASRWRDALISRYPTHPRAVEQRTLIASRAGARDAAVLDRLESLWNEAGEAHSFLPQTAGLLALDLDDARTARRWLDRYAAMRPEVSLWAAATLARFPELRRYALSSLEAEVSVLEQYREAARPLELSRGQFRREAASKVADAAYRLAATFLSLGDTANAARALERAIAHDWHSDAMIALASIVVERGDLTRATELLARAAADPASDMPADSAVALLDGAVPESEWRQALDRARDALTAYVLDGATSIAIPAGTTLTDSAGTRQPLHELLDDRPAVIAFWSPWCGPSIEQLPAIQRLADRLDAQGARLLLITNESLDAAALSVLRSRRVTLSPYTDASARLRNTLQQWRTPELYVVDADARVRFAATGMSRVEREIMAISAR